MDNDEWNQGIVYLRHIDKKGHGYIEWHSAWNTTKFIENCSATAIKEGGRIEVVTEADYQAEHWKKRAA